MVWSSVQTFGNQIIGFGVSLILARILLPSEFGLIAMIGIFMAISSVLISSGLSGSLIRTDNPTQEDYSTVFIFNLVGSVALYLTMYFAAPFIADFFNQPPLVKIARLSCTVFIINAFSTVQITRLHKNLDFKTETKASLTSAVATGITGITLAYLNFGVMSLVWMGIVGSTINVIMLWGNSGWKPSLIFNKQKFQYHFNFGSKLMASSLLDTVFTNAYTLIIGKFFSATQLGFYNRADSMKQLPVTTLSSILNKVTFPIFAKIKDDDVQLKSVYKQIMQMIIFIVAPILAVMAALGEPLIRFLFTEKWLPSVPYLRILCISGVLFPLHGYNLSILNVKGRSDLFLRLEILKKILVTVIVALSLSYGIYGLLWGQVIFSYSALFINTYYSGRFLKYPAMEQFKDIFPILFLAAAMCGLVYFVDLNLMQLPDLMRIIVGSILGISFYLIFARLFKFNSGKSIVELIRTNILTSIPFKFNSFK